MRRLTTLLAAALLLAAAPGGALAATAAGSTGTHASTASIAAGVAPSATAQIDCSFPVSRVDATGTNVTVYEDPGRVVVLAPSAAQVMWELNEAESVVGLPTGPTTAYLAHSQNRTDVTNPDGSVNVEKVVGLQPDLVLAPNIVPNSTVQRLRRANVTVYKVGFGESLESITRKVRLFGRLTGACEQAAQVNAEFRAALEEIRAMAPEQSPRVLYYFYNFTTGSGTFIHEAIQVAGGDNVAANAGISGYKPINPEIVAARNPQWIVRPSGSPLPSGEPWSSTAAYRLNQTLTVNSNLISQPAPRVVKPMRTMARAFRNTETVTPSATPSPAGTATTTGTGAAGDGADQGTPAPGADSGGQPGFGLVTALVAALALVARAVSHRAL